MQLRRPQLPKAHELRGGGAGSGVHNQQQRRMVAGTVIRLSTNGQATFGSGAHGQRQRQQQRWWRALDSRSRPSRLAVMPAPQACHHLMAAAAAVGAAAAVEQAPASGTLLCLLQLFWRQRTLQGQLANRNACLGRSCPPSDEWVAPGMAELSLCMQNIGTRGNVIHERPGGIKAAMCTYARTEFRLAVAVVV